MRPNYAERARALVGTPFRPQGRDQKAGLDCVGLVLLTYDIAADAVRRNYRLRGVYRDEIARELSRFFRAAHGGSAGDLMLLVVSTDQLHFAVQTDRGFVHADARL